MSSRTLPDNSLAIGEKFMVRMATLRNHSPKRVRVAKKPTSRWALTCLDEISGRSWLSYASKARR